jgi:hypothetical protein
MCAHPPVLADAANASAPAQPGMPRPRAIAGTVHGPGRDGDWPLVPWRVRRAAAGGAPRVGTDWRSVRRGRMLREVLLDGKVTEFA